MVQKNYLKVKPLSVNDAWKGRRFRSDKYNSYKIEVSWKLPKNIIVPAGKLILFLEFGFSSEGSDFDNPIKPFQDIISKQYGFNDNRIIDANIKSFIVPKGKEYIKFFLESANKYEFKLVEKI